MRKRNIICGVLFIIITLVVIDFSCKKDNIKSSGTSGNSVFSSAEITQAQNAEHIDVVFDKIDNDMDNDIEAVETKNFYGSKKSASSDCVTLTVDHLDTTTWPKVLNLSYTCFDTVTAQHILLSGKIGVTIDTLTGAGKKNWRNFYKRTFTYTNFMIASDSDTLIVNGIRMVYRSGVSQIFSGGLLGPKEFLVVSSKDSILTNNLTIKERFPDSSRIVSRNVLKTRYNKIWYKNSSTNPASSKYVHVISKDSAIFTGAVTGIDARGESYSRKITSPLITIYCPKWPSNIIITSGTITQTINNTDSIKFNYTASANCGTKVSIVKNGKSIFIDRKFTRKLVKWW